MHATPDLAEAKERSTRAVVERAIERSKSDPKSTWQELVSPEKSACDIPAIDAEHLPEKNED